MGPSQTGHGGGGRRAARGAQRVLILRPDHIGDVLLFSGALRPIRDRWPASEISLVVRQHVINLIDHCPHVDRMEAYESWCPQRAGADVLLLPVRSPTAAMHADVRKVAAAQKLGIAGDWNNQTETADHAATSAYGARMAVPPEQRWRHELEVTGDFLRFIGCDDTDGFAPEFWLDDADREFAATNVPDGAGRVVGIMPEASHPCRVWPVERYADVVAALPDVEAVVLFGGGESRRDLARLGAALKRACGRVEKIGLAGRATLRQTAACVARCDLLISTETWVLHAGVTAGVPTVGIMGGGHYGRFYPWGVTARHRTARRLMDCYHCNWQCPYAVTHCIHDISANQVIAEARAALDAGGERVRGETEPYSMSAAVVRTLAPARVGTIAGQMHAKYVRALWRALGAEGESIAIFGGGAHTHWFLQTVWDVNGPPVACILDDAARDGQQIEDIGVRRPEPRQPPCRRIVVVSDRNEPRLAERVFDLYGDAVEIVQLYENMPIGPYARS